MQIKCLECNKEFRSPPSRERKYCSFNCYNLACRIARRVNRQCPICGKRWIHQISQGVGRFCSRVCYTASRFVPIKICEICDKSFKAGQKTKVNRFCSLPCYWKSLEIPEDLFKQNRREYTRKYRREHRDKYTASKQKRRALEVGAKGHFTENDWKEIKEKQNQICLGCKEKKKLTADHIIPLSKGGSNYPENIQGLCINCNSKKWVKI
jgi:5-methylcytosine-specific restriction endonuclease McrA